MAVAYNASLILWETGIFPRSTFPNWKQVTSLQLLFTKYPFPQAVYSLTQECDCVFVATLFLLPLSTIHLTGVDKRFLFLGIVFKISSSGIYLLTVFYFLIFYVFIHFRGRGREGETHPWERKTLIIDWLSLVRCPTGDRTHNPGTCPEWGLNS